MRLGEKKVFNSDTSKVFSYVFKASSTVSIFFKDGEKGSQSSSPHKL